MLVAENPERRSHAGGRRQLSRVASRRVPKMGEPMEAGFSRGDASILLSTLSLLVGVSLTIIGTVVLVMYVDPRGSDRAARHPWRNAFLAIFLVDLAVNFYLIFLLYLNTLGQLTI